MERFLLLVAALLVLVLMLWASLSVPPAELETDYELMQQVPSAPPEIDWFQETVIDSEKPVLVDFKAVWCGPCHYLSDVIQSVEERYSGRFEVVKVDVDEKPEIAAYYGINSYPTVLWFEDGEVVDGFRGAIPERYLEQFVLRNLE